MTIDESMLYEMGYNTGFKDGIKGSIPKEEVRKLLRDTAEKVSDSILGIVKEEYIPKTQYENRLKADLAAMLTEIQLEIDEEAFDMVNLAYIPNTDSANVVLMDDLNKIIQQKINSLKEA